MMTSKTVEKWQENNLAAVYSWVQWWKVSYASHYGCRKLQLAGMTTGTGRYQMTCNDVPFVLPMPQEMLVSKVQVLPIYLNEERKTTIIKWLTNTILKVVVGQRIVLDCPPILLVNCPDKITKEQLENNPLDLAPVLGSNPLCFDVPFHIRAGEYFSIDILANGHSDDVFDPQVDFSDLTTGFFVALWGAKKFGVQ